MARPAARAVCALGTDDRGLHSGHGLLDHGQALVAAAQSLPGDPAVLRGVEAKSVVGRGIHGAGEERGDVRRCGRVDVRPASYAREGGRQGRLDDLVLLLLGELHFVVPPMSRVRWRITNSKSFHSSSGMAALCGAMEEFQTACMAGTSL